MGHLVSAKLKGGAKRFHPIKWGGTFTLSYKGRGGG